MDEKKEKKLDPSKVHLQLVLCEAFDGDPENPLYSKPSLEDQEIINTLPYYYEYRKAPWLKLYEKNRRITPDELAVLMDQRDVVIRGIKRIKEEGKRIGHERYLNSVSKEKEINKNKIKPPPVILVPKEAPPTLQVSEQSIMCISIDSDSNEKNIVEDHKELNHLQAQRDAIKRSREILEKAKIKREITRLKNKEIYIKIKEERDMEIKADMAHKYYNNISEPTSEPVMGNNISKRSIKRRRSNINNIRYTDNIEYNRLENLIKFYKFIDMFNLNIVSVTIKHTYKHYILKCPHGLLLRGSRRTILKRILSCGECGKGIEYILVDNGDEDLGS